MLYTLQIVEALLEEETSQSFKDSEATEEQTLKSDWIERFLSIGGF